MGSTVNLKKRIKEAQLKQPSTFKNFVTWFEIPAYNHYRSVAFFNYIYGIEITTVELNGYAMGFFPAESRRKSVDGKNIFERNSWLFCFIY